MTHIPTMTHIIIMTRDMSSSYTTTVLFIVKFKSEKSTFVYQMVKIGQPWFKS